MNPKPQNDWAKGPSYKFIIGIRPHFRFDFDAMVKCDDDTIINVTKLKSLLANHALWKPFYGGYNYLMLEGPEWPETPVERSGR